MPLVDQLMSRMALHVLGVPMFIVSTPDLVIAQCTSGVIGAFPALNAARLLAPAPITATA